MHTIKWFQVLLYTSHNLISVICLHTVYSIWPGDWTLSGATTPAQSGHGCDVNKVVPAFPKAPRLGSRYQMVWYYIQDTVDGVLPLYKDAISVFCSVLIECDWFLNRFISTITGTTTSDKRKSGVISMKCSHCKSYSQHILSSDNRAALSLFWKREM